MKQILLILSLSFSLLIVSTTHSMSQTLSVEGKGHYNAALLLFETSSSVNDYLLVAEEFEAVVKTDPQYKDVYINLCKIYSRIGAEKGEPYFSKAKSALSMYKTLAPNDIESFTEEQIALNAMRRKFENNVKSKKMGDWYLLEGNGTVYCPGHITISENIKFFYPDGDSEQFSNIDLEKSIVKVSREYRSEYGRYTVGKGSITDHDILIWHSDGSLGSIGGVSGYYDAYKYSKTAVQEKEMLYYNLLFEGDRLLVTLTLKGEYLDKNGSKIFHQDAFLKKFVFLKH